MKKAIFYLSITVMLLLEACGVSKDIEISESTFDCALPTGLSIEGQPKQSKYQSIIDEITNKGVPGIMMTIYDGKDPYGPWMGASGKADLKNDINLKICNISRVGSTVKMFTAVTVLKLAEEGKLNLDDKAALYLSNKTIAKIENAEKATIRQLLQHSSGIYNYIISSHFQTASLNDLVKEWNPEELLDYARYQKANFVEGTDVNYSNTNYILLGIIIENIEEKPFYNVFQERIFDPLNLTFTSFAAKDPVPNNIIRGYIDLYSKLEVTDATYFSGWDYYTADGGLISNPYDLYVFFKSVVNKEIITSESFSQMTNWISPSNNNEQFYGLGIFKMKTKFGDIYIHSGDAIGYAASMMYLTNHDVFICWASNGNYGKIDKFTQSIEAMEHMIESILE